MENNLKKETADGMAKGIRLAGAGIDEDTSAQLVNQHSASLRPLIQGAVLGRRSLSSSKLC